MSLQSRLASLIASTGADVKLINQARDLPSYVDPYVLKNRYDPVLSVFNLKASNTRKFRAAAAKAQAGLSLLEIIYVGDSLGAGATSLTTWNRPKSPPMALRNELARRGIPVAGTGFVRFADSGATSYDSRFVYTGSGWNLNGRWYAFSGVQNDQVVFTSDVAGDKVKLTYNDLADGVVFSISVDGAVGGAGFQSVTASGPAGYKTVTLDVPVKVGSTITIKKTSATAATYMTLMGLQVYNTTQPGVIVHNLSQSGSFAAGTTHSWSDISLSTSLGKLIQDPTKITASGNQPALAIIGLGGNDKQTANGPISDVTVLAGLATIRSRFTGDAAFVGNVQLNPTYTPIATWEAFLKALYEWCDLNDYPLFDIRDKLGDYATMVANGQTTDGVGHVLAEVSEVIGRTWGSALGFEFGNVETPKIRVVPVGTTGFANEPDGTIWIEYTP